MHRLPLLCLLTLATFSACRHTRVEVVTEVGRGGEGTRTVTVLSEDDGQPAEHPDDLVPPAAGFTLVRDQPGHLEAVGSFPDLNRAPNPFAFRPEAFERSASSQTRFAKQDWVLFTRYQYAENLTDVIEPEDVKAVIDEFSVTSAEVLEACFVEMFGDNFDQTVLRRRLRGDLREMFREIGFLLWQELSLGKNQDEEEIIPRLTRRITRVTERYGLKLRAEWLLAAVDGENLESEEFTKLRHAVAAWLQESLQPVKKGERVPVVPDMNAVLFDGPFLMVAQNVVRERFGGLDPFQEWLQGLWARAFGAFGPDRGDVSFVFKVRMPGQLLRSNGFLSEDGWSFVQFRAGDVYPNGAGMECESLEWDYGAVGSLPAVSLIANNRVALEWMDLTGGGPLGDPDEAVLAIVRECIKAQSLEALETRVLDHPDDRRAARLLAWLKGEGF